MNGYSLAIKDMPESMRPRERMLAEGEHSLSDTELLAIIIGNGTSNLTLWIWPGIFWHNMVVCDI
jgi:DNA repair protein RadC